MAARPIVTWPDSRLSTPCAPVGAPRPTHWALADDMLETMYAAQGRGLAAPQLGELVCLLVMDPTWKEGHEAPLVVIDPELITVSAEELVMEEACLSIPGIAVTLARPASIRAGWTDLDGSRVEAELTGIAARIFQHELDHLNGVVTLDCLPPAARAAKLAEYAA